MKKAIKILLIVSLVILVVFLADQGLHLIYDAPLNTCKKAYEKLEETGARVMEYKNDELTKIIDNIHIDWDAVGREFKVEKDEAANTITFYCYDGSGTTCMLENYITYSKHIFAFDPEGRLSVYCRIYYNGITYEVGTKMTYKVQYRDENGL